MPVVLHHLVGFLHVGMDVKATSPAELAAKLLVVHHLLQHLGVQLHRGLFHNERRVWRGHPRTDTV